MPLFVMGVSIFSPCYCAMLRKASRRVSRAYDAALAPMGLKTTQFSLLAAIDRAGEATIGELADILVMDRSTLGHNLRPLEREKLLMLSTEDGDARTRRVRLTASGVSRLAEARRIWRGVQERFENTFGSGQAAALHETLLQVAAMKI